MSTNLEIQELVRGQLITRFEEMAAAGSPVQDQVQVGKIAEELTRTALEAAGRSATFMPHHDLYPISKGAATAAYNAAGLRLPLYSGGPIDGAARQIIWASSSKTHVSGTGLATAPRRDGMT